MTREQSRIILLHVLPPSAEVRGQSASLINATKKRLRAFNKSNGADWDHVVRPSVCFGTPFQEILNIARESNVQLIVLGLDDSGALRGVELGHTVDLVSRYAKCPVLLARASESQAPLSPIRGRAKKISRDGLRDFS